MLNRNVICLFAISVLFYIIWKEHVNLESERRFCATNKRNRQHYQVKKSFPTQDAFLYKNDFDVSNNLVTVNTQIHPSSYQPTMGY